MRAPIASLTLSNHHAHLATTLVNPQRAQDANKALITLMERLIDTCFQRFLTTVCRRRRVSITHKFPREQFISGGRGEGRTTRDGENSSMMKLGNRAAVEGD